MLEIELKKKFTKDLKKHILNQKIELEVFDLVVENLNHPQAEIPNIFSVWDECFSSARNYKNPMSKTNLDFLYTT